MKNRFRSFSSSMALKAAFVAVTTSFAWVGTTLADPSGSVLSSAPLSLSSVSVPSASADPHYGLLGLLDSRSQYGKGAFPEPFIVDDSDLEVNELRLDWLHTEGKGANVNAFTAEFEKGFGSLTLELEVHYDYDHFDHELEQAFDNVDLGARYPLYQYVSPNEFVDSTFGVAIEVGIPTNTPLSKNTEIVPKIFDDLRLGDHFTAQCILGYSFLRGSGDVGGNQSFEYGFVFGWTIQHNELPIPGVEQIIPVFEMQGETLLNTHDGGSNSLLGNLALRINTQAIGRFQPRLGIGYVFPMDQGSREDLRWGIYTSLVFDF